MYKYYTSIQKYYKYSIRLQRYSNDFGPLNCQCHRLAPAVSAASIFGAVTRPQGRRQDFGSGGTFNKKITQQRLLKSFEKFI